MSFAYPDYSAKSSYIALFCLFLLWGIALVSRWACGDNRTQSRPAGAPETGVTTPTDVESPIARKFQRAHDIARDFFLWLLAALLFNSIGNSGSIKAVEVLTWIFFAFAVLWMLAEMVLEVPSLIRFVLGIVQYAIIVAIISLAFAWGWASYQ